MPHDPLPPTPLAGAANRSLLEDPSESDAARGDSAAKVQPKSESQSLDVVEPGRRGNVPAWHQDVPRRPVWLRRAQIGAAWMSLLLLTGLFVWASTWLRPPRPVGLVLLGAGYQDNLAVAENALGWRSLQDLASLTSSHDFSGWGKNLLDLRREPIQWRTDTQWQKDLADCPQATLMVVLAMQGGADANGAYLLPHDATASDVPQNRVRLAAVIDAFAKLPPEKNKVLVLDCTAMVANWELGMLRNDFARQLEELAPRIEAIDNLVVISASDVDQRSWGCREYRRTIFLHHVIEGLKGAARDTQNDGRIDAWELHAYVASSVRRWAQVNRGVLQTPVLLPRGELGERRARNIDLAVATKTYRAPDFHGGNVFEEPPELNRWWQTHARLASQTPSPMAHSPQLWRQYQGTLLRCEQLLLAGDLEASSSLSRELAALEVGIQRSRLLSLNCSQNSLSMPAVSGVLPPFSAAAQQAVSQLWNTPAAEVEPRWNTLRKAAEAESDGSSFGLQVAAMLYERAAADPVTNLGKAGTLLRVVEDPLFPRPAEVQFLTMLRLGLELTGEGSAVAHPNSAATTPLAEPSGSSGSVAGDGRAQGNAVNTGQMGASAEIAMDAELLALALSVRRLAEKTAVDGEPGANAYSSRVYPWIASQVQASDSLRRAGEDLLFAGSVQHAQARQLLHKAQAGYQQAWFDGCRVREACHERNRAFAVLPYYSRWLAQRCLAGQGTSVSDEALVTDMQSLWADTHDLNEMLAASPAVDSMELSQQLQRLAEQTETVRRRHDALTSRCTNWWWNLSAVELPSVWHEAHDALLFPQEDPELRAKLRSVLCRTSRRLLAESTALANLGNRNTTALPPVSVEEQCRLAQNAGRRQGLMALAVLGKKWFNEACATEGPYAAKGDATPQGSVAPQRNVTPRRGANSSFLEVETHSDENREVLARQGARGEDKHFPSAAAVSTHKAPNVAESAGVLRVNRPESSKSSRTSSAGPAASNWLATTETFEEVTHRLRVFSVEENWWTSLTLAGDQIGRRWWQMTPAIESLIQASQKTLPWPQRKVQLEAADQLCRKIDGASASRLAADPAALYRRLCTAELLMRLAERCWKDHWYSEDPQSVPYYRLAAMVFLDDAAQLTVADEQLAQWKSRVQRPGNLVLQGPPKVDLTTEQHQGLVFKVEPAEGAELPAGSPVLWVETGPGLEAAAPEAGQRQVRAIDATTASARFPCVVQSPVLTAAVNNPPPSPQVESSSVTAKGWFRGQRFEAASEVYLHLCPDVTMLRPATPEMASVAVRASPELQQQFGDGTGSVAIVLDASGSMGPPAVTAATVPPTTIPKPQAAPSAGSASASNGASAFKYQEATQALRDVLHRLPAGTVVSVWVFGQAMGSEKTVDDANRTVRRIQDPMVWNPADPSQLSNLMSTVSYPALEPWNQSPIVRAMMMAKQDLVGAPGFKSLVVLTDGQDNCFAQDKQYNPSGRDIASALRDAFAGSGIAVNIVGFKVEEREKSAAFEQFKSVETWSPPGRFVTVDDTSALANLLHAAMRQRMRYWVENYDSRLARGMPANGLDVTLSDANDQWYPGGLAPGSYKIRTFAGQAVQANFGLNRGDLLLLQLGRGPDGVQFGTVNYSTTEFPWKPFRENACWRMAVLQNQQTPANGLQMLVTLEQKPQFGESTLQMIAPRELWMEVEPANRKEARSVAVRWGSQYGYPAPAWSVNAASWPQDTAAAKLIPPQVAVWWNPDQTLVPSASLDRGHDFRNLEDLRGQQLQVGQQDVTVEGVDVEEHLVEVSTGQREPRYCLVVRVRHEPRQTIVMSVAGISTAASESRMYRDIGRTTALFWPVTRDEAAQSLTRLKFYSVDEFKARAEQRGFFLKMDALPSPAASDSRPLPYLFPN